MPIRIRLSRSMHPLPLTSPFAHIPTRPDIPARRKTKPGLAKRNNPIYRIILQHSHKRRDATGLEVLGIYDPVPRPLSELQRAVSIGSGAGQKGFSTSPETILEPVQLEDHVTRSGRTIQRERTEKLILWDADRIRYWLSIGAEPTDTVVTLLCKGGLLEMENPEKSLRSLRQAWAAGKRHAERAVELSTGLEKAEDELLPPSSGPTALHATQPLATHFSFMSLETDRV